MGTVKIASIFTLIAAFFGLFVFGPWYARMDVQTGLLLVFLALNARRHGYAGTARAIGFVLPFVLSLLVFGAIFEWLELMGRTDWMHDSLLKALVFPNSFLAVKLGLESITFRDILDLPLNAGGRRGAIVLKAVMEKCTPLLHRYRFLMDASPHFDGRRAGVFLRLCGVIVAAYISIYQQTEKTQALFDHRTHFIRKQK